MTIISASLHKDDDEDDRMIGVNTLSSGTEAMDVDTDPEPHPSKEKPFESANEFEQNRSHTDLPPVSSSHDSSSDSTSVPSLQRLSVRRLASPISPVYEALYSSEEDEIGLTPCAFEVLPTELVQNIATHVTNDSDLSRLTKSSPSFAQKLNADNADIWQRRFLARYDYPMILRGRDEFSIAYKLRRFVLRKSDGLAFANGEQRKAEHQLQVLSDMVQETYNRHKPHLPPPKRSKNLAAMSSPDSSPWISKFMGCALFGNQRSKYGQPHLLFDMLHVTLSHLVLNQRSPVVRTLASSRENYDLTRVYNFNQALTTLLERLPEKPRAQEKCSKRRKFPELKLPCVEAEVLRYRLNIHDVLHIRNFWQRHFADEVQGIGENTYTCTGRDLVARGMMPQKWDGPLSDFVPVKNKWIGHYSCLHPWPKDRQDLEERQSCAEDWDAIDPMTLELETSSADDDGAFWPPIFSGIPIFEKAMPDARLKQRVNVTYVRGISSFLDLHDRKGKAAQVENGGAEKELPKWHPFLASRVHGFVHDVPKESVLGRQPRRARFADCGDGPMEEVIPGWKRICMIMYKPTTRQMVSVLEHAEEAYGGASGTEMGFNTADIWMDGEAPGGTIQVPDEDTEHDSGNQHPGDTVDAEHGQPTEEQIEGRLRSILTKRIHTFSQEYERQIGEECQERGFVAGQKHQDGAQLPGLFSARHIRLLEENFSAAKYTTWDDGSIEWAYAYEGIIIPGGKIMLGRYWRIHGGEGMGAGKEVGPDGQGVEVRPVPRAKGEGDEDGDAEKSSSAGQKSKKRRRGRGAGWKKRQQEKQKKRSRSKRAKNDISSDDENSGSDSPSDEEEGHGGGCHEAEKEVEYEFVTMVNGEESRAVNAAKGLERGPFVFWAT